MSKKKKVPSERWPGMTIKEHHRIGKRIRDVANLIGLRDWLIKFSYTPCEGEDSLGEVKCTYGQKVARVMVCKDFVKLPKGEQNKIILHELIHCHLDGIHTVIHSSDLETVMGAPAFTLLAASTHNAIEWATDAIASEWAAMLWPDSR